MKIDPNVPAFSGPTDRYGYGLTIRAHFAAMAMQGLLASPEASANTWEGFAEDAVKQADALIAYLNKDTP